MTSEHVKRAVVAAADEMKQQATHGGALNDPSFVLAARSTAARVGTLAWLDSATAREELSKLDPSLAALVAVWACRVVQAARAVHDAEFSLRVIERRTRGKLTKQAARDRVKYRRALRMRRKDLTTALGYHE